MTPGNTVIDGIFTINERGTIQSLNSAALSLFGYTAEELIGKNVNMLMPEPYHSEHDDYLQNYLLTNQPKIMDTRRDVVARRKDGSTFPLDLEVSEVQMGRQGGDRLFIGVMRNSNRL
jgi:PAS domain S-box-containing protein